MKSAKRQQVVVARKHGKTDEPREQKSASPTASRSTQPRPTPEEEAWARWVEEELRELG